MDDVPYDIIEALKEVQPEQLTDNVLVVRLEVFKEVRPGQLTDNVTVVI